MTDHNINNFFDIVDEKKKAIIGIILTSILIAVFYALSATPLYKTSIYVIPPQAEDINALNIRDKDGKTLTTTEFYETHHVYRAFMVLAQSRKSQRDFFFNNNLDQKFNSSDPEEAFEDFHKNLSFRLQAKVFSREVREEKFLTVSFLHHDSVEAANILNQYIDGVIKKTSAELANGANILISNKRATIQGEVDAKINLARQITKDRIVQLEEAFKIAVKLNIVEMQLNAANQQSVVISDDNLLNNNPLYLYGSKAIKVEIDTLSERKSEESFVPGLRALQQQVDVLDSILVSSLDVKAAQIDQKAIPTLDRYSPKRKLIVFLGAIFGVFLALIYVFGVSIFSRKIN